MTNKYCADLQGGLWLQYNTANNNWFAKPCCLFQKSFQVNTSIDNEFWKHPEIVQLRQQNLDGQELPLDCSVCTQSESNGNYSRRQSWNDRLGTEWAHPDSVIEIDIQADFSCNLACNICGPQYSTLWRQIETDPTRKIEIKKYQVREKLDSTLDIVLSIPTHNLRQVHFQGGEPLMSLTHMQILEELGNRIDLSNVSIWYHSNGTVKVNDNVLKFWEKFKLVEIYFSLDDMGQRMEYQRWPSNWNVIHNNMLWYRENAPNNVMFNVERTVGILNAYWIEELDQWHRDNFSISKVNDPININYHQCTGLYSLSAMSSKHQDAILNRIPESHWVHKHTKNLTPGGPKRIGAMLAHLKKYDLNKNPNWETVYPEFLQWYAEYL